MDTESPRALEKREGRKVHCGGHSGPTKSDPILQPATVTELRALHLIARHHTRPAMALALAALAYGEAR